MLAILSRLPLCYDAQLEIAQYLRCDNCKEIAFTKRRVCHENLCYKCTVSRCRGFIHRYYLKEQWFTMADEGLIDAVKRIAMDWHLSLESRKKLERDAREFLHKKVEEAGAIKDGTIKHKEKWNDCLMLRHGLIMNKVIEPRYLSDCPFCVGLTVIEVARRKRARRYKIEASPASLL